MYDNNAVQSEVSVNRNESNWALGLDFDNELEIGNVLTRNEIILSECSHYLSSLKPLSILAHSNVVMCGFFRVMNFQMPKCRTSIVI